MTLNRRELLVAASAVVVGGVGGKVMPPVPKARYPLTGYTLDEKHRMLWAEHTGTIAPKPVGGLCLFCFFGGGGELEEISAVRFWYLYIQSLHGGKFEHGSGFFREQAVKQLQGSFGDDPNMFKCLMAAFRLNLYQGK